MKKLLFPIFGAAILLLFLSSEAPPKSEFYSFNYENVLGTSFMLKVAASSEVNARNAEQVALKEIDRLADILSTYDSSSEFRQWMNTLNDDIPVSPELFEVLSLFEQWESKTGGALNASAAIATSLWRNAEGRNQLPGPDELSDAISSMERTHWELNDQKQTARHMSKDPLVLNSFVKSYIISKASEEVMSVPGVTSAILNIGGDIVVAGEVAENLKVADPMADAENDRPLTTLRVSDRAIATSGNYRRGFKIGDEWYSHILDPRTAIPASEIISATVVARNATDAGALATAFNILSPEESEALAHHIPGIEYLIVTRTGDRIASNGWSNLEVKQNEENTNYLINKKAEIDEAAADFEVAIEIELTRFEGRSLRPYVAVWVENEKTEPVRTLALWFNNYRWLPDLRKWYSKHYEMTQQYDFMSSITSATRPAGKYTIKWDCLDHEGKHQKSGEYTIYIEVSRERGTYQLIKREIDLNRKPQRFDLESGIEISSAAIEYYKVEKNKSSD
jgi:thiamine biosynthesis lipoprotein ApbE